MLPQNLAEESAAALTLWMMEKVFGGLHFKYLASIHENHAVGNLLCKAHFVRHAKHGHSLTRQFHHDVQHFIHHFGVESGSRFVK